MKMYALPVALLPLLLLPASSALACEGDEDEHEQAHEDHDVDSEEEDDDDDSDERQHTWRDRRIGVQPLDLTPELREHFGAPREAGVMLARVERNSPAEKAGLRVGDIVIRAAGQTVNEAAQLAKLVSQRQPGQTINLELIRGRTSLVYEVRVEAMNGRANFDRPAEHNHRRKIERALSHARERIREKMRHLEERLEQIEKEMKDD